jgi:hypothetical protein
MEAVTGIILEGYRQVHRQIRAALETLDPTLLDRTPAPDTSPIAALVRHTLGSEGDVLYAVAGLPRPSPRDRAAEFRAGVTDPASLYAALEAADRLLDETGPHLTAERLGVIVERPGRSPRTGLGWLVANHAHVHEHLAHLELTRQILLATR